MGTLSLSGDRANPNDPKSQKSHSTAFASPLLPGCPGSRRALAMSSGRAHLKLGNVHRVKYGIWKPRLQKGKISL